MDDGARSDTAPPSWSADLLEASRSSVELPAAMRRRQLELLAARHLMEEVILVRVLVETYQHVAVEAKSGDLDRAERDLAALHHGIASLPDEELRLVVDVGALPVRALVRWKRGDLPGARDDLLAALDACSVLVARYDHDYLTRRRLHLAVNLARLHVAAGEHHAARRLLQQLHAVAAGDVAQWPFAGADTLSVPLSEVAAALIGLEISTVLAYVEGASP